MEQYKEAFHIARLKFGKSKINNSRRYNYLISRVMVCSLVSMEAEYHFDCFYSVCMISTSQYLVNILNLIYDRYF